MLYSIQKQKNTLTFLTPRISSIKVAVCRKVFLFVIKVKRNRTKSSLAARLFVTPSIYKLRRNNLLITTSVHLIEDTKYAVADKTQKDTMHTDYITHCKVKMSESDHVNGNQVWGHRFRLDQMMHLNQRLDIYLIIVIKAKHFKLLFQITVLVQVCTSWTESLCFIAEKHSTSLSRKCAETVWFIKFDRFWVLCLITLKKRLNVNSKCLYWFVLTQTKPFIVI